MSRYLSRLAPAIPLAAVIALLGTPRRAGAEDAENEAVEKTQRCATRLSIAMVGESAPQEMADSPTPQDFFDTLVRDPRFIERFAKFVNAEFNRAPGEGPGEDAPYYLARFVLQNGKPWSEMFRGPYEVGSMDDDEEPTVKSTPNGLGYFRSYWWAARYAGNEADGVRIATAYRMMQNTIGLKLVAVTTAEPGGDATIKGRSKGACAGCHFNNWYALDKVAAVLGRTVYAEDDTVTYTKPSGKPERILGGVDVRNDKELIDALVDSEAFNVNACRLTFKYLYGRQENSCEGQVFDKCVDAFKASGQMADALAIVAKDPSFCE